MQNIKNDTELIIKHPFIVSNDVKDININITAIHRIMKDLALSIMLSLLITFTVIMLVSKRLLLNPFKQLQKSEKNYVLLDSSKIGKKSFVSYAKTSDIDLLITDSNLSYAQEKICEEYNLNFVKANQS